MMLAAHRTQPGYRWRFSRFGKNGQACCCFLFSEGSSSMGQMIAGPPHSKIYPRNEPSRMSFRNYLESSRAPVWPVTSQATARIMATAWCRAGCAMNYMKYQGKRLVGVCIAIAGRRATDTGYKRYACRVYASVRINLSSLSGSRQESRGAGVTKMSFGMGADSLLSRTGAARQERKKIGVARGHESGGSLTNNKRGSKICSGT
ncbi:MAG: hypothetical protein AW10_03938 [Candidatus Accumulibacter appositus]|uniref:Uncharacterized protein n=1 Tax=Candidatus Accumulibacter appositus TaxID=1454003 RepID=A0A011PK74_9PROT|nr:MAG: hypothetical protein AW10_03938 [Candidatus Accumulibacter appositus]